MITTAGKLIIKQFLPQGGRAIASTMVVGVGSQAESLTDSKLQFESARVPIDIISYDYVANLLIFKATIGASVVGSIYEVGLFTQPVNTVANGYGSKTITSFNQATETWTSAAWDTVNVRYGADSLKHTPAASATTTSTMNVVSNFSGYSGADDFVIAFNNENTNASSIVMRFKQDASNYFSYTISNPSAGYQVVSFDKSTATITGAPSWSTINMLEVATTAKSAGAAAVEFDAIRVEDTDSLNPEYVMVARKVLSTPIILTQGIPQEIEYGIPITI